MVYAPDAAGLDADMAAAGTESDKRSVAKDYLKLQSRITCILEKVEDAVEDNKEINCDGRAMVVKKNLSEVGDGIDSSEGDAAKRAYLTDYIDAWNEEQRVDRVVEGLSQMKRTKAIPLFGRLVSSIHNFPIAYEGEVLVPKKDLSDLLDEFSSLNTKDARRELVDGYLLETAGSPS